MKPAIGVASLPAFNTAADQEVRMPIAVAETYATATLCFLKATLPWLWSHLPNTAFSSETRTCEVGASHALSTNTSNSLKRISQLVLTKIEQAVRANCKSQSSTLPIMLAPASRPRCSLLSESCALQLHRPCDDLPIISVARKRSSWLPKC